MTDNNYPPLPDEAVYCDACTGFSAAQMHAYIDADRAQRKPLTDETIVSLPVWRPFIGLVESHKVEIARAIEAALDPPPRPDAGNN